MKAVHKRLIAVGVICGLIIAGAGVVVENEWYKAPEMEQTEVAVTAADEESESAIAAAAKDPDLIFWYEDETYAPFLEKAVASYFEETGVYVQLVYKEELDYTGEIYNETMEEGAFPDAYLLSGEQLEEVYLYGVAAQNDSAEAYQDAVAANAVTASSYNDKMIGYPLSYNVCLFVYQNGYFETTPESIQAIIDYSDENEPAENVKYLLEWDVNDAFYDFPFISNSVSFVKEEAEVMEVQFDENLYNEDLTFFQEILESFSIDTDTVSEEGVIADFIMGSTVCAIVDSDSMYQLKDCDYTVIEIPDLNETLKTSSCALTDMVVVNDFTENEKAAEEFAKYLTLTMADELHAMTGHYSVVLSKQADHVEETAYSAYENAVLAPSSQDALDFWVTLKETIANYFS